MKLSNPHIKRLIIWIISIVMALMIAMVVDSQIPLFWNYDRKIRYAIYLLSVIICAYPFTWVLNYTIHLWKTKPRQMILIYVGLTICISFLLALMGIKPQSSMPEFVFQGNLEVFNRMINLVIPFVILPYMVMIFLISAINRHISQLSSQIGNKGGNIDIIIMNYPKIFVITFLVVTLLPLTRGTDLNNIERTFWGRGWLIKMYSGLMVNLGNEVYDNSLMARDNWLIFGGDNSIDDFQNTIPFTDQDLEAIQQKLDSLSERLAAKGIKLLVTIPPNKNTIYPEYLPPEIPIIGDQSRLDQLMNYEKQFGKIKILDLRPALMAERSDNLVYYRTDTHWNGLGAFIAYQEIMKELQNWYPNLVAHTISDYQIVDKDYTGDIGLKMIKYDITENAVFLKPLYERNYNFSTIPSGQPDYPNMITSVPDTNLPSLLMVGDSFAYGLQPFLSEQFSRALYIWSFPKDDSYYDTEKPDVVIIEITERDISRLLSIP